MSKKTPDQEAADSLAARLGTPSNSQERADDYARRLSGGKAKTSQEKVTSVLKKRPPQREDEQLHR